MNKILTGFLTAILLAFSVSAFADKVIITGEPIVVEQQADVYVPAKTVTTNDYYYFTMGDKKRVCYREVQEGLVSLDAGIFAVKVGPDTVQMHCYDYSPDYFVVQ